MLRNRLLSSTSLGQATLDIECLTSCIAAAGCVPRNSVVHFDLAKCDSQNAAALWIVQVLGGTVVIDDDSQFDGWADLGAWWRSSYHKNGMRPFMLTLLMLDICTGMALLSAL